jgi:hypothetical protein
VEIAESLFAPHIKAAFRRITRGEFHDDQRCWQEEEQRCQHPQADRRAAVMRSGGNPPRAQHGGNVEEQNIPEAHRAAQL